MSSLPDHIILFDGVCNLCNSFVRFVIRYDKKNKFHFASLQSDFAKQLLEGKTLTDSVVLYSKGRIYTESTAALNVLRMLGRLWPLLYGFILVPKFIRDSVYRFVARHRYRIWGKRDECMIPSTELKAKFLA